MHLLGILLASAALFASPPPSQESFQALVPATSQVALKAALSPGQSGPARVPSAGPTC